MNEAHHHVRSLGRRDMVLFTVSAILLLDTLAAGATVGPPSVFWWLILGIVFFVPYALICSEMGTTYPEQGGIYAWIRDAFGRRWASRATWAYWVNTAVWLPAIFILFAGIFSQIFAPDLSMAAQIAIGIVLTWIAVAINIVALNIGKWVPNLGAIIKLTVFLAIIVGAFLYTRDHGMANPLTLETMTPSLGDSIKYIPVIIYGMLGFELVSAGSEEMKQPARDVPVAILVSGAIIITMYTLATISILAAVPAAEINLVEGLMDTLRLFLGSAPGGQTLAIALGIGALYTFFSNGVTWALGCNRAAAEAAIEGELPRWFGVEHAVYGTPKGAALSMGVVSTTALLMYGFLAGSNEDLFWDLFAFSAVIFLLPYIAMVLAFLKMRVSDGDRHRPFRIAGGLPAALVLSTTCALILGIAVFLFVYTPGEGIQWPVFLGASVVLAAGELIIRLTESHRAGANPAGPSTSADP